MVILTRFLLLLSVVLTGFAQAAVAGTFYIDYASGNDSNTGTNKSVPWKRCPGMPGFSGAYSHTSGDRFIFKGGVTWAASAFPCNYTYSGSGESNRDYIGVDKAWFAGASWTRPRCVFQKKKHTKPLRIIGC
jgi:hypothetical protein